MADDARLAELHDLLAERLIPFVWSTGDVEAVIAEIAPVVSAWAEREAARRAAEELRAAAEEFCQGADELYDLHTTYCVRFYLRAAALTPASEEKL